ncbi:MAG: hypothetical protein QOG68_912, partial [Solirubrobacteraceae bacterium]|nr:hypothetical protein [Solirubrobacteraceae bacterium]
MLTTHPSLPQLTVADIGDAGRIAELLLGLLPRTGIIVADAQLRIRLLDGEVYGRRDLSPGSAVDRQISDVVPAAVWDSVAPHWAAALRGDTTTIEWSPVQGVTSYWLHFAPLRTQVGDVVGAAMVAQDITERLLTEHRLERRATQQAAIARLGSMALHGIPTEEILQEAAGSLKAVLDADFAAVLPYRANGGLEVRGVSSDDDLQGPSGEASTDPNEVMTVMRDAEEPLLVDDLRLSEVSAPVLQAQGMVSLVVAAIGAPANRYGLFGATSRAAGAFTQDDLAFVQSMANVLAEAVERERAAAEAAHREGQLNEAQRLAGVGSWEIDLRTGEHTVSDHLREMLGLVGDVTGAEDLFACIHVDDRPRVRRHMAESTAQADIAAIEFRILGADGSVRLLQGQGSGARDADGRTITLRGSVQDVTDQRAAEQSLRRSEERFRQGFDSAPIGMTLIDPASGRFLRVNAAYCRLVGRSAE